jgi:hypothetical protein
VLYYHLAAGLIQSISYYSTFCKEFRMACAWNCLGDSLDRTIIQKRGASLPKSAGAKLHRGDEASGRRSKRLRGVEDEEAPIGVSPTQTFSDLVHADCYQMFPRDKNWLRIHRYALPYRSMRIRLSVLTANSFMTCIPR